MIGLCLDGIRAELPLSSEMPSFEEMVAAIEEKVIVDANYSHPERSSGGYLSYCSHLPLASFRGLSFAELFFSYFHSKYLMSSEVEKALSKRPDEILALRIESSMRQWGMDKDWDTMVRAYRSIRDFRFDIDGFEISLDHTRGDAYRGASRYSGTFLDGKFAFLVHYQGKYVMTIGFSIVAPMKVLVLQVQMKKSTGNRFLYKLPAKRIEFILSCFVSAFSGFSIYLVDGQSLVDDMLADKKRVRDDYEEYLSGERSRFKIFYQKALPDWRWRQKKDIMEIRNLLKEGTEKLERFREKDYERLVRFYSGDIGIYARVCPPKKFHRLDFYRIQ